MDTAYLVADVASGLVLLAVAVTFVRIWTMTRQPRELVVAGGFLLLACGTSAVYAGLVAGNPRFEGVRAIAQAAGAFLILFAYASSAGALAWRTMMGPVGILLFVAAAGMVLAMAIRSTGFGIANLVLELHMLQFFALLGCAAFAARSYGGSGRAVDLMVPLAFLAAAFSTWTWIAFDISRHPELIPFAYVWRVMAVVLLLGGILVPANVTPVNRADES